jgi:hypothetical protein
MSKYVAKFEAASTPRVTEVLKDFKLKISDLQEMYNKLVNYHLDGTLQRDLKTSMDRGWRDLRKWKVQSFLDRYDRSKPKIEEIELIEDYFLELVDKGYRMKIDPNLNRVIIYTKDVSGTRLNHFKEVIDFFVHLNNTNRLLVDLESVKDSNELWASYKMPGQNVKDSSSTHNVEDDDVNQSIDEIIRILRHRRLRI